MSEHNTDTAEAAATQFAEMARKITENATNGFSGAVVVVPPGGNPINLLLVSPIGDEALFWATLKTQVDIRLGELAQAQSGPQGFGGRY
jgi:hypothetical protein